jgi:hypothetical protein
MTRRITLALVAAAIVLGATAVPKTATADPFVDQMFRKSGYVGLLLRPVVCMSNCGSGTVFSFGAEAGYKFIGLALRYGYKQQMHFLYPDLRFYWEIGMGRNLTLTPLLEFTPQVTTGGGASNLDLVVRPGVRIGWAPVPYMMVFLEPIAVDLSFFHRSSVGSSTRTSTDLRAFYTFGFGLQARF